MNIPILIAKILTLLAFVLHTFVGDKELKVNEPTEGNDENFQKREKWTMARCGWHWVSFDLLFATIGLGLANFTDLFTLEHINLTHYDKEQVSIHKYFDWHISTCNNISFIDISKSYFL